MNVLLAKCTCDLMFLVGLLSVVAQATSAAEPGWQVSTVAGTGAKALNQREGPAGEVNIGQPFGVEVGPDGRLYITEVENHRVLRLDPETNRVTTVAGNGKKGFAEDGAKATAAPLNEPYEVRFDSAGRMVFVEMVGAVIRRFDPQTGLLTRIAGTGKPGFSGDSGPATEAQFKQPHSIAFDEHDNLYVADIGNHRIRKIDAKTGVVTTICGNGRAVLPTDGAVAAKQPIRGPRALFVSSNQLYVALREGNSVWRVNLETGRIHYIAGTGAKGANDGPAKEATFNGPKGLVASPDGNRLYLVDTENQTIREVDLTTNQVTTIAGSGRRAYGGDSGPALEAAFDRPHGIGVDPQGNLYVGDTNNHRVRRLSPPEQKSPADDQ